MKLQSLQKRGSNLANASMQVAILEDEKSAQTKFKDKLDTLGFYPLRSSNLEILQVNVGYMCDLTCAHCHVDAGPDRKEIMTKETMQHCLEVIKSSNIKTIDLTGGAPELNPNFQWFVEEVRKINTEIEIIVRSNITILVSNPRFKTYPDFFKKNNITVIASMPCYTKGNVDKQRGDGVFNKSIEALKNLNEIGYGVEGSGLQLHLVYNPGGASLPGDQMGLQHDYKIRLKEDWDIDFNNLYTITNLPISRFLDDLIQQEKYDLYMDLLVNNFNPSAVEGIMCRNTISVDWQGNLYDCDFNQMLNLKVEDKAPQNISDFDLDKINGREIVIGQHCYGCTAGAGSSCQGSLV